MAAHMPLMFLCLLGLAAFTSGYAGEYIPKSYYIIANGHRSDTVYLRSKRSLLHLLRKRRSSNIPGVPSPEQFYAEAHDFLNKLPHGDIYFPKNLNPAALQGGSGYGSGSGSGAYSYSGASASSGGNFQSRSGYSGGGGPAGNSHHYSNVGPDGPQTFSRFGEGRGDSIQVSGSASGPNGAYSSSSAATDGGKVRYSVQTGKY